MDWRSWPSPRRFVGLGFGVAQNASVSQMFRSVPGSAFDTASAFWNIANDAGMGVGAAAFGLLVGITGFPVGFALAAGLVDEFRLHLVPVLLGGGTPLFAPGPNAGTLRIERVQEIDGVVHLTYRVDGLRRR